MVTTLRVALVDPDAAYRRGTRLALEEAGHGVVFEAARLRRSDWAALAGGSVDVVLADVTEFEAAAPVPLRDVPLVVLTRTATVAELREVVGAGAAGYVARDIGGPRLVQMLEDAACGQASIQPALVELLIQEIRAHGGPVGGPTRRQREVSVLARSGMSTAQIAATLGISEVTVRRHRSDLARRAGPVAA